MRNKSNAFFSLHYTAFCLVVDVVCTRSDTWDVTWEWPGPSSSSCSCTDLLQKNKEERKRQEYGWADTWAARIIFVTLPARIVLEQGDIVTNTGKLVSMYSRNDRLLLWPFNTHRWRRRVALIGCRSFRAADPVYDSARFFRLLDIQQALVACPWAPWSRLWTVHRWWLLQDRAPIASEFRAEQ